MEQRFLSKTGRERKKKLSHEESLIVINLNRDNDLYIELYFRLKAHAENGRRIRVVCRSPCLEIVATRLLSNGLNVCDDRLDVNTGTTPAVCCYYRSATHFINSDYTSAPLPCRVSRKEVDGKSESMWN